MKSIGTFKNGLPDSKFKEIFYSLKGENKI